jgi:hypothetical protein
LHDLALDAPMVQPPEPPKEGQFSSLVANPAHKQIFPPLHLTVGKNPRIAYQSHRQKKTVISQKVKK